MRWINLFAIVVIALLINFTVAYSYNINQIYNQKVQNNIDKDFEKFIGSGLKILVGFLSIKQIGSVSALEEFCCKEMKDTGATCQKITSEETDLCKEGEVLNMKCELSQDCSNGCCFDPEEGICAVSPKTTCESTGGEWTNSNDCLSVNNCVQGCCILGDNVRYITETRCTKLSLEAGIEKNFRFDLDTEISCLAYNQAVEEGACVYSDGSCRRTKNVDCEGTFFTNFLCSNSNLEDLGVNCEPQVSIGCSNKDGENGIYWFDSCGNKENIYEGGEIGKTKSWNNGQILDESLSCTLDLTNPNSVKNCGNCNYLQSSKCSVSQGDMPEVDFGGFVCEDLTCVDEWGNMRHNQESWCSYDGLVGDGRDAVGSTHWKRSCNEGKIESINCGDNRNRICEQTVTTQGGHDYLTGDCKINTAQLCFSYNSNEETMETDCNQDKHCMIKNVDIDDYFQFNICVPQYPKGDQGTCSIASEIPCTVYFEKNIRGEWNNKENRDCTDYGGLEFGNKMNDLCVSLGDCGSYINWIGDGTNNIQVSSGHLHVDSKPPLPSWRDYLSNAIPDQNNYAEFSLDTNTALEDQRTRTGNNSVNDFEKFLRTSGASGESMLGMSALLLTETVQGWFTANAFGIGAALVVGWMLGAGVGNALANQQGRTGAAADAMIFAGGAAGALAAAYALGYATSWTGYGAIIAAALVALISASGWGEHDEVEVKFTCGKWQPPAGGDKCEECNKDPLKPCTKYRCESLGRDCEIVNFGVVEFPECIAVSQNDADAPELEPHNITQGYKLIKQDDLHVQIEKETSDTAEDAKCIEPFTKIDFNLNTSEHAQCKWALENVPFEDMYFTSQNTIYTETHPFEFVFSSIDAFQYLYNADVSAMRQLYGDLNMYVRCKDSSENENTMIAPYVVKFCVREGIDQTAVSYNKFKPQSNSFIEWGETEKFIEMFIDKPAECKYDTVPGKLYEEMSYNMNCDTTSLVQPDLNGWPCNATITDLTKDQNKIYIKCKNNPWQPVPENRYTNAQDIEYVLQKSKNELIISDVSPTGDLSVGSASPFSNEKIIVKTSGGAKGNGEVESCEYQYSWGENSWYPLIYDYAKNHYERELTFAEGSYEIPVRCTDIADNIATANISFNLQIDNLAPEIATIYKQGSSLIVKTYEKSRCYYNTTASSCDVSNMGDSSTNMEANLNRDPEVTHSVPWEVDEIYHVRCEDVWGNKGTCVTISPSDY